MPFMQQRSRRWSRQSTRTASLWVMRRQLHVAPCSTKGGHTLPLMRSSPQGPTPAWRPYCGLPEVHDHNPNSVLTGFGSGM